MAFFICLFAMNPLNLPTELPIARYRLHFTMTHDLQLPSYAASTLRGVFGHALLAAACTCDTPQTPHLPDCPYAQIFEPAPCTDLPSSIRQSPPPPYLIETPLVAPTHFPAGAGYAFDLVLFGKARHSLPLIAAVFAQAFAKGLGANNAGKGELNGIAVQQADGSFLTISEHGSPIALHCNHIRLPERYPTQAHIQLLTPLRIQQKGRILRETELTQAVFLRQLLRRYLTLAHLHWGNNANTADLSAKIGGQGVQPQLSWHEHRRFSNRQKQITPLSGAIGTWQLTGLSPAFSQMLYIGQWLHLGKETVFGNGQYRIIQAA